MDTWLSGTNNIYQESPWLLFQDLDWSPLTAGLKPESFCKGSFVYHQNQKSRFVYLIKSGRVNLSIISADGKVKTLFICGEGALFGEISCFMSPENCAEAQAVSDSLIYKVEKTRYQSMLMSNSTISYNTNIVLAKKVRALTAQMESTLFPDATKRVATVLLYLAGQYGKPCDNGVLLTTCFSHQEMADLIGASRVTVTNAFRQLVDDGVVSKSRGNKRIVDKERLQEMLTW